jgi:AAA15 family ATPase/GTPase
MGTLAATLYLYLKSSCLRLIAAKMKLKTKAQVYKRFGKHIIVSQRHQLSEGKAIMKTVHFALPKYKNNVWDFKIDPTPVIEALYANPKSIAKLMDLECALCGSKHKVEMHHIRQMSELKPRSGKIDRLMIKNRRKQIALCIICHMKKHSAKSSTQTEPF